MEMLPRPDIDVHKTARHFGVRATCSARTFLATETKTLQKKRPVPYLNHYRYLGDSPVHAMLARGVMNCPDTDNRR